MTDALESVFDAVNDSVVELSLRWKLFCQLFDSGSENIALLNNSGAKVFALFQRLVLDDVILTLSRLTDPASSSRDANNANASFKYLLQGAGESLDHSARNGLQEILVRLEQRVSHIRTHRNKAIAHADLEHALDPDCLPGIRYDNLEAAMQECRDFMSALGKSLFQRRCSYEVIIPFRRSGTDLLNHLKRAQALGPQTPG